MASIKKRVIYLFSDQKWILERPLYPGNTEGVILLRYKLWLELLIEHGGLVCCFWCVLIAIEVHPTFQETLNFD